MLFHSSSSTQTNWKTWFFNLIDNSCDIWFVVADVTALLKDENKLSRVAPNVKPLVSTYNAAGRMLNQIRVGSFTVLIRERFCYCCTSDAHACCEGQCGNCELFRPTGKSQVHLLAYVQYVAGVGSAIPFQEAAAFSYTPYVAGVATPMLFWDSCEKEKWVWEHPQCMGR